MNAFAKNSVAPTARRRALRQAVTVSLAALAMVGLAACGTSTPTSKAAGASADTAAAPAPADTAPAAQPSSFPSAATVNVGATTRPARKASSGTLYYQVHQGGKTYVYSLRGATVTRHLAVPSDTCAVNSLSVSPDGRRVAWVSGDDQNGGKLTVANLDGSHRKTLPQQVYCLGNFPAWTDSRHMKVGLAPSGTAGLLDLASGRFTAQPGEQFQQGVIRSANGAYQAYRWEDRIVVRTAKGALVRQVWHGAETEQGLFTVTGVSDDGRYVAVGPEATDPSRIIAGWSVFDTVTGRNVPLAVKATRGHAGVYLGTDGAMVLRIHENGQPVRLCQVSGSGDAVCRPEPAQLGTHLGVIGYRA